MEESSRASLQIERLDEFEDVLALDEGHFDVELGELGGAVGAQVFVAVAAGQLEIAVQSGHHQQLFELLRRLRQRVGLARVVTAGHHEVARALGRALDQRGRLQFQEVALPQELAHQARDLEPQFRQFAHPLASQVEVAMGQTDRLVDVAVRGDLERRWLGGRQNLDPFNLADFDLAGCQVGVGRSGGAFPDLAGYGQYKFGAHARGRFMRFGVVIAVDRDLGDAVAVAQVDEDEAALIAPAVHPAVEDDGRAGVGAPQRAAGVGAA